MAISPPSDIVLDVVRAADPTRRQEAVARLTRLQSPADGAFETMVADAPKTPAASVSLAEAPVEKPAAKAPAKADDPTVAAFRGFEAMTLASMVEAAMPKNSAMFGSGPGSNVWRSMLAEQIGRQMAESGGIGLAEQLAASFRGTSVTEAALPAAESARSLLTDQINRAIVGDLMPGEQTG